MLLLSALTLVAYAFPVGTHLTYNVDVAFDGYMPVLGGQEATADMAMTVDVVGVAPDVDGSLRASSEIKALKLTFNDTVMPFGPANVKDYFPKTTAEFSAQGKLIKTDAPNTHLPVHLPGLDVKRFPDITYLPIEFPVEGIAEGKVFKFSKPFGVGPVDYEVTPTSISADKATLTIKLHQIYVTFEDEKKHPIAEASATARVTTDLTGTGTATLDLKRSIVTDLNIDATSIGKVVNLKSNEESERKLKTVLTVHFFIHTN